MTADWPVINGFFETHISLLRLLEYGHFFL